MFHLSKADLNNPLAGSTPALAVDPDGDDTIQSNRYHMVQIRGGGPCDRPLPRRQAGDLHLYTLPRYL